MSQPSVIVIGAGTMGTGIAQVALASGHRVFLVDTITDQTERARDNITRRLSSRAPEVAEQIGVRLSTHADLDEVAALSAERRPEAPLVIEAVVENLAVKQEILAQAQRLFGVGAVLATNTSSFSVTAIAQPLDDPSRVVGLHFFNPVPVMKLVEVVPGIATDPALTDAMVALVVAWSKTPVRARSTPGFIVNRVARPFYGESLLLAEEQAAPIEVIDTLLRNSAGFRMGPFQLMDLVGNDVNSTVTRTVWEGHHFDPRFAPSILQAELVAAGRYGRKTGRGFYAYDDEADQPSPGVRIDATALADPETPDLALARLLDRLGVSETETAGDGAVRTSQGTIVLTRGHTAVEESVAFGTPVVVVDRPLDVDAALSLAFAATGDAGALVDVLRATAGEHGLDLVEVGDVPGLVTARVAAMLVNEASEVVRLGLCSAEDVDLAMTLGTNYPIGLLAWRDRWTARYVQTLIDTLADQYRSPRYRTSLTVRQAALSENGTP